MTTQLSKHLLFCWMILAVHFSFSQKVGLVLSGGGASGMAHIGVLIALEENNIPIDYITGTSAGALVGGLYAIGYTPKQIKQMATSPEFYAIANGQIDKKFVYFFKQRPQNAEVVKFSFNQDLKQLNTSIPLSITDPALIDFFMVDQFSGPSSDANYNFDSLLIPFRCVASDIDENKEVVFKKGNLSQTVRASMTYPFYLPPLTVNGKLLVDGGLYNNFPADVMYTDFLPDMIIGSSVTQPRSEPADYDLISQVTSMIQTKSNFKINCPNSLIVEPKVSEIGTFEFEKNAYAIEVGYEETMLRMDSIKASISRRTDTALLKKKRVAFMKRAQNKILISEIKVSGVKKGEEQYIISALVNKKDKTTSLKVLRKRFFRLITDDKIEFMFPVLTKIKGENTYSLAIKVKKQPEFDLRVGGSFTSKANNTGYLGLDYKNINKFVSLTAANNFYFGRFYNSIDISPRLDFPFDFPFYIEPHLTYNRWDFYRSFATFFEDTKPSYLIKNEAFWGVSVGFPASNKGKVELNYNNGLIENEYYQTDQFISTDTADVTQFFLNNASISYERNSLDNFYFSKTGSKLKLNASYIGGVELNKPGSTSALAVDTVDRFTHDWFNLSVEFEKYFQFSKKYSLGILANGNYSTQDFFNNYTSSILIAPQFSPIPETQTQFNPDMAAHSYLAFGLKNVVSVRKSLDFRLEGYAFLPLANIEDQNKVAAYNSQFLKTKNHFIASAILVYKSPLGPVSLTGNYMDFQKDKFSFLFNFNFLVFNRKALGNI
ncbi:MAG: patatin-like phospholipase family protein [Flavobacteriales bacterium]